MKYRICLTLFSASLCFMLVSCGANVQEEDILSEEELRSSIATEIDAESKIEAYEKLFEYGVFDAADYVSAAALYGELGNTEKQYEMLSMIHRLEPSEQYVNLMSQIVWHVDDTDEGVEMLVSALENAIQEFNGSEFQRLVSGDEFLSYFSPEFVGVEKYSIVSEIDSVVRVKSGVSGTIVEVQGADGKLLYGEIDSEQVLLMQANTSGNGTEESLLNRDYQGEFQYGVYTLDGAELQKVAGTIQNGVVSGELVITIDGVSYTGTFDDNGHTTVEQVDSVTEEGSVVYAYNEDESLYLYIEGNTVDSFQMNVEVLGLPELK